MPTYNNYYPASYQPFGYQMPQMQAQPQIQTPQIQQTGMIWVNGEQEAQMYPVAPNNAVALWDSTSSTIYLKQADASGRPMFKTFDLVERTQPVHQNSRGIEYATKDELNDLVKSVQRMQEELSGIKDRKKVADDAE